MPISQHNTPLPPDELFDVRFNYEWRRLVVERLWPMTFDDFWSGSDADVQAAKNAAVVMIEDIYTAEPGGGMIEKLAARSVMIADMAIPGAVWTPVVFAPKSVVTSFDFGGFRDDALPTRLTVPAPDGDGLYQISAQASFALAAVNNFQAAIHVNGTTLRSYLAMGTIGVMKGGTQVLLELVAGDYVELWVRVNPPRTLQSGLPDFWTFLEIVRLYE